MSAKRALPGSKSTEEHFRKTLISQTKANAIAGSSNRLENFEPEQWGESEEKEKEFLIHKRQKRKVEELLAGGLLSSDVTAELNNAADQEQSRIRKSRLARESARSRLNTKLHVQPPTNDEFRRRKVFIDTSTVLPADWATTSVLHEGCFVTTMHAAEIFIASNPWKPTSPLLTWAAALRGSWIVPPSVYLMTTAIPVLKFRAAARVQRKIWISPAFRQAHPRMFLLILETVNKMQGHKWTFIDNMTDFCNAKARAEKQNAASRALALVTNAEAQAAGEPHVLGPDDFLGFISIYDDTRTSVTRFFK